MEHNVTTQKRTPAPGSPRPAAKIILALLCVVGLGIVIYLVVSGRGDSPGTPATPDVLGVPLGPTAEPDQSSLAFDVVRVAKDGTVVVAGRAPAGAVVNILANGDIIAVVTADARGEWTAVISEPLPPGDFEITLQSDDGQTAQTVLVSVPAQEDRTPLVVISESEKGSRVLQGGGLISEDGSLFFESVDYDAKGNMVFSGYGREGATVRIYLDDRFIGEGRVAQDGRWVIVAQEPVPEGVYVARVDLLDAAGAVIARVQAPFEKAVPQISPGDQLQVTIVPGDNLWTIARHVYGSGWRYTVIFDANANQINNPDLIYPGQVFTLPQAP